MFNLEQSIAEWRKQMLAAGIKSPTPLEELEGHLREEMEQRVKSGYSPEQAFELSLGQIGQVKALKCEFKKIENTSDKKIGAITVLAGVLVMLQVLTRHYEIGRPWKTSQIGWMVFSGILIAFGLGPLLFNFKLGHLRDIRLWKLAGISYAAAVVWISTVPVVRLLSIPKFSAAFNTTDRILIFTAMGVSLMSVLGWRFLRKSLPVIQNWRTRTAIGIAYSLLGPGIIIVFNWYIIPASHLRGPLYFVLLTWMWTTMAVLGGVGYGLAEAASQETEALDSKYV